MLAGSWCSDAGRQCAFGDLGGFCWFVIDVASGDDAHVDSAVGRRARDLLDDGSSAFQFLPAAAAARADHDLGDLPGLGELDDRQGGIVGLGLVSVGTDVGGSPAQDGQLLVV
jgi:hypothetical protein